MRLVTAVAFLLVFVALAMLVVFGVGITGQGGTLEERWVSDTARENRLNHHAVGVSSDGEVIVAPVAAVPSSGGTPIDTSCALVRLAPSNGSVLWRNGVPPEDCFTHALTEPAIEDIDGDGRLDVISSTTEGAVVAIDARTGREQFRAPLGTYGYGQPTVADLRPEPGREVVTSDINGNVVLVHADGTVAWRTALNESFGGRLSVWDAPTVADIDADGSREIVIGTGSGPAVLSSNGTVEWIGEAGAIDIVVAEVDGDQGSELFTTESGTLRAIDGQSKEEQWRRSLGALARIRAIADGDGDGTAELYAGLSNGTVVAFDATSGQREWKTTISTAENAVVTAPVLADVGGTISQGVVAATRDGTVAVLDAENGAEVGAYERTVPIWTFVTPADVDGDGDDEILVRYGDGRVVALDYHP
jgi:outer membrane protein assembly factor BamB